MRDRWEEIEKIFEKYGQKDIVTWLSNLDERVRKLKKEVKALEVKHVGAILYNNGSGLAVDELDRYETRAARKAVKDYRKEKRSRSGRKKKTKKSKKSKFSKAHRAKISAGLKKAWERGAFDNR